jgi:branched-chain amino acid transport system ATP-binding protein
MSATPIIAAEGLHTFYGTSHILHGIDFEIRPGETVGLLGRNGMGKTTLLRSLLGLTPPRQGEVHIKGKKMTGAKPYAIARQGITFVPEGRGIFPKLSVREHLALAARKRADGKAGWDMARVLASFPRLKERLGHGGAQLSGGEQQMLTIGRALMTNPDLLILDEATEGLSPLIAQEIWAIIRRLRAGGLAAIVVDKNFAAVSALADRHVVLVKGQVVLAGSGADLKAQPDLLHRHLGV